MAKHRGYNPRTTQRLIKEIRKQDLGDILHNAIQAADPTLDHAFTPEVAKKWLDAFCHCGHNLSAHSGRWNNGPCRILSCWCHQRGSRYEPAPDTQIKEV